MTNLSKPTNSLISNLLIAGTSQIKPTIGMGATMCFYTDRKAGTIIEVFEFGKFTYIKHEFSDSKAAEIRLVKYLQDNDLF